jgi:hypothetical protein
MWITQPREFEIPLYCYIMGFEDSRPAGESMTTPDRVVLEHELELGMADLFRWGGFRKELALADESVVGPQVVALLDWLWRKRGRPAEVVDVPDQSYYDVYFFSHRRLMIDLLTCQREERPQSTTASAGTTRDRRPIAEQVELTNRIASIESQLADLAGHYDLREHHSTTEMTHRYRQERQSLQLIVAVLGDLSAIDLAVTFLERLDQTILTSLTRSKNTGLVARQPRNQREQQTLAAAQTAIADWVTRTSDA